MIDQHQPPGDTEGSRNRCPSCGSTETKELKMSFFRYRVVEIRSCRDCPARFKNLFEYVNCERVEDMATFDGTEKNEDPAGVT
jgi:formate dehydrogenase maturation protein FdhE